MNIKKIKREAKQAFKSNYFRCVIVAFIMDLLIGGSGAASARNVQGADATGGQGLQDAFDALTPDQQMIGLGVLLGVVSVATLVGLLLRIFVFNPIQVGGYHFFRKNNEKTDVAVGTVMEGFGSYGHTFVTLLLRDVFLFLWSMLFVIPGFVKMYSYRLVPYLIKDEPELSAVETITRSRELMDGHKLEAFWMDLSFIGWFLFSVITCGLGYVFYVNPYYESAKARFYLELVK